MIFSLNKNGDIVKSRKKISNLKPFRFFTKDHPELNYLMFLDEEKRTKFQEEAVKILEKNKIDKDNGIPLSTQIENINRELKQLHYKYNPGQLHGRFDYRTVNAVKGKTIHIDGFDWVMKKVSTQSIMLVVL